MSSSTPIASNGHAATQPRILHGQLRWHDGAPDDVTQAGVWGDDTPGWKHWRKHLARRRRPRPIARLLKRIGFEQATGDQPIDLDAWVQSTQAGILSVDDASRAIEVARSLPESAANASAASWWPALEKLLEIAEGARKRSWEDDLVTGLMLHVELPLTLAYVLPELANCRELAPKAMEGLAATLAEALDGDGLPHGRNLQDFRPLLACWTRTLAISQSVDHADCTDEMLAEFNSAVVHTVRLARRDGSQAFDSTTDDKPSLDWLMHAAKLTGKRKTIELVDHVLDGHGRPLKKAPSPADNSEWSELAVLRTDWSRDANSLVVNYSGKRVQVELRVGRETILAGALEFEARLNGRPLSIDGEWEEVCWETDEDADYLELEARLSDGWRLSRQFILSRTDDFLLVADALLGPEAGELNYRASLPLAEGAHFEGAQETNEGKILARKPRASVLPLALSEWRSDPRGSLQVVEDRIELRQQAANAKALYAPMFFDLRARRLGKRLTWRQLTVAEDRAVQRPDVAVGYRVQIGKQQWLLFKSLQAGMSRTVLGHHLFSDFLAARFTSEGTIESLMEIE